MPALAAVATLCGALGATPTAAHFATRTDSLYGFTVRSDLIVIARIRRVERFEERGHTTIPGGVRLVVEDVLKGDVPKGELGVRIDGLHQPTYAPDERVLVFAERSGAVYRSMQSRSEKVVADEAGAPLVAAVRRFLGCLALDGDPERACLSKATFDGLVDPVPRLHQDAVVDLLRPGVLDTTLDDDAIARLGKIAISASTPLVVRQGVTAKLGALFAAARRAAFAPLESLAAVSDQAAVRVAAITALGRAANRIAAPVVERGLADGDRFVRYAAVEATALVGRSSALEPALRDADPRVRYAALKALLRLDDEPSRAIVARFRTHATEEDRTVLAKAVAETRLVHGKTDLGDRR